MRCILLFGWLVLFSAQVFSQPADLRGIVLDGQDMSALPQAKILVLPDSIRDSCNQAGLFQLRIPPDAQRILFSCPGYKNREISAKELSPFLKIFMEIDNERNASIVVKNKAGYAITINPNFGNVLMPVNVNHAETYDRIIEHKFVDAAEDPLSTFALSVDRASYSNVRRFISMQQPVPPEAVRIEELINYFHYHYRDPENDLPLAVYTDLSTCPWEPQHWLLRIAVKARALQPEHLPPNNLVFLLDVSGSMDYPNKLPLLQRAFRLLVNNLRPEDRVAIVVYAGSAGLVLPSTSCAEKEKILNALDHLHAGGSTAGGAGIKLAYQVAQAHFIPNGNNRVILATDGDFNMGQSSDEDMRQLILQEQGSGISLTCLGVGMNNYKDSKLETLARWGSGNFAYIDNQDEAEKVFGEEVVNMLFALAKDTRLHILFDPQQVKAYRLIGYENRLGKSDDSTVLELMGGDIGAGSSVTAFYELEPTLPLNRPDTVPRELATVSLQYKGMKSDETQHIRREVSTSYRPFDKMDDDYRFASAIALWGLLLRHSRYTGQGTYDKVEAIARRACGDDEEHYRRQFLKLLKEQQKQERKSR